MNGLDIFSHSLRQVFGNFAVAVKISALLYLVQFGVTLWLGSMMPNVQLGAMDPNAMRDVPWGLVIVSYLVLLITGLWIAVAWHTISCSVKSRTLSFRRFVATGCWPTSVTRS